MKKIVALLLSIMLLATMFVMTGCSRRTTVVMTVDGFDADTIVPATAQDRMGCSKQMDPNGIEPIKYIFNGLTDGDYSMLLLDLKGNSCPFTLKIHNGKVEAETPEGVTVCPTIK